MAREKQDKPKAIAQPPTATHQPKKRMKSESTLSKKTKGNKVPERSARPHKKPHPAIEFDSDNARAWYHRFEPYGWYISEHGINGATLKKNYPEVCRETLKNSNL